MRQNWKLNQMRALCSNQYKKKNAGMNLCLFTHMQNSGGRGSEWLADQWFMFMNNPLKKESDRWEWVPTLMNAAW